MMLKCYVIMFHRKLFQKKKNEMKNKRKNQLAFDYFNTIPFKCYEVVISVRIFFRRDKVVTIYLKMSKHL